MNDLVAVVDRNPGFNEMTNGLKMIDGAADSAEAFGRGDWIEGSANGLSAAVDVVGAVVDPIGTLGSMFAGWLLSHIGPVQDALDELLGDPATIQSFAQTWENCAGHLRGLADDYRGAVAGDLSGLQGMTMDAYRDFAETEESLVRGMGNVCTGVGAGVALGGTVLAGVREFIVQIMSDAIGQIIKLLGEAAATLGIAAPHAITTAANKARELIQRTRTLMTDLAKSLDKFADLVADISPALEKASTALAKASRYASEMNASELTALQQLIKSTTQLDNYRDPQTA
ncbi:hypothetical protein [Nocardioides sp. zg-1228]|uniref:hypothetical protein n=1 Tax=Nocardioides sp. zg-1228 TaxID=2763008 RepID=UPI001642CFE0|nr:hypothetical protein [Nocardioides sp. zg-1228]MBC2932208.1 hypothetical protein [Nocardioides sp. zg-1228]QSF57740.1 hypothetical protein JX575_00380 [Nocardioides sp. zg-1228]